MAHVRTALRDTVKLALDDNLPVGEYIVYASRKSIINHRSDTALIDMRFSNDQTREADVMGDARVHVASLYVRVQRSVDDEATLDTVLDQDEVNVILALEAADWSSLLETEPELTQVNFTDDTSTGRTVGGIVLRFDMEYRIEKTDPETIIA